MSHTHYIYSKLPLNQLEFLVSEHQKDFDLLVEDFFTEQEILIYEKQIDSIAAIYVQPILSDLTFDDFYPDPKSEDLQRTFFSQCRSSISMENIPYLESNPFQVTYLIDLIESFDEVLIDRGGISELTFKRPFLDDLKRFKTIDQLVPKVEEKMIQVKTSRPVDPIDFLILDVYKEFDRLKEKEINTSELSAKVQKIYAVMKSEKLDSTDLLRRIGLNPKDFDDGLERLKFWLRSR